MIELVIFPPLYFVFLFLVPFFVNGGSLIAPQAERAMTTLRQLGCEKALEKVTLERKLGEGGQKRAYLISFQGVQFALKRPFLNFRKVKIRKYNTSTLVAFNRLKVKYRRHIWKRLEADFLRELNNVEKFKHLPLMPLVILKCVNPEYHNGIPPDLVSYNKHEGVDFGPLSQGTFSIVELAARFHPEKIQTFSWVKRLKMASDALITFIGMSPQRNSTIVGCAPNEKGYGISVIREGQLLLLDSDFRLRDYSKLVRTCDNDDECYDQLKCYFARGGLVGQASEYKCSSNTLSYPVSRKRVKLRQRKFRNKVKSGICRGITDKWLTFGMAWSTLGALLAKDVYNLIQIHAETPIFELYKEGRTVWEEEEDGTTTETEKKLMRIFASSIQLNADKRPHPQEVLSVINDAIGDCENAIEGDPSSTLAQACSVAPDIPDDIAADPNLWRIRPQTDRKATHLEINYEEMQMEDHTMLRRQLRTHL